MPTFDQMYVATTHFDKNMYNLLTIKMKGQKNPWMLTYFARKSGTLLHFYDKLVFLFCLDLSKTSQFNGLSAQQMNLLPFQFADSDKFAACM